MDLVIGVKHRERKPCPFLGAYITAFRGDATNPAAVLRRGDTADAEPAVPGWRITVEEAFA